MHLASGPISVTVTLQLPEQPVLGTSQYIPLGGDGLSAPFAAHTVRALQVEHDASGGTAVQVINLDPRFCGLVSFMTGQIAQAINADADMSFTVTGNVTPSSVLRIVQPAGTDFEVARTWEPPPIILPGGATAGSQLRLAVDNVDGDDSFLDVWIYLFNIRARELTPMGPLLFGRGSN